MENGTRLHLIDKAAEYEARTGDRPNIIVMPVELASSYELTPGDIFHNMRVCVFKREWEAGENPNDFVTLAISK